jgi:hypothetical protein
MCEMTRWWLYVGRKNFLHEGKRHYLAGIKALSHPHLHSALAGAEMIYPAQALPFIASDAAVAFWYFSAIGKGLAPAAMSGNINNT